MKVKFYDKVEDRLLKFTVILAKYQGSWVFCKHKERDTYEIPGGHREKGEDILCAAKRELMEETGIEIIDYKLFDADSVAFEWQFKKDVLVKVHHTGIFFTVSNYNNEIKNEVKVNEVNDDSLGAEFFNINELSKNELSAIAILELEKLGYKLN